MQFNSILIFEAVKGRTNSFSIRCHPSIIPPEGVNAGNEYDIDGEETIISGYVYEVLVKLAPSSFTQALKTYFLPGIGEKEPKQSQHIGTQLRTSIVIILMVVSQFVPPIIIFKVCVPGVNRVAKTLPVYVVTALSGA
jgi:hypothetical protein